MAYPKYKRGEAEQCSACGRSDAQCLEGLQKNGRACCKVCKEAITHNQDAMIEGRPESVVFSPNGIAAIIRKVDGKHDLGAGPLGEAIYDELRAEFLAQGYAREDRPKTIPKVSGVAAQGSMTQYLLECEECGTFGVNTYPAYLVPIRCTEHREAHEKGLL